MATAYDSSAKSQTRRCPGLEPDQEIVAGAFGVGEAVGIAEVADGDAANRLPDSVAAQTRLAAELDAPVGSRLLRNDDRSARITA
jgi:hypothetical protein